MRIRHDQAILDFYSITRMELYIHRLFTGETKYHNTAIQLTHMVIITNSIIIKTHINYKRLVKGTPLCFHRDEYNDSVSWDI